MFPLAPLLLSLAPTIGNALFGSKGEAIATAATTLVQTFTGTSDPAQAEAFLSANPEKAGQLRVELARIAAEHDLEIRRLELAKLKEELSNTKDARSTMTSLVTAGSKIAWAPVVVSSLIIGAFVLLTWRLLNGVPVEQSVRDPLMMLTGAVIAGFSDVRQFWLGSNHNSSLKDQMIYNSTPTLPAAVATSLPFPSTAGARP